MCIVEGGGSNDLVESKRGNLFHDATLPPLEDNRNADQVVPFDLEVDDVEEVGML